MLSKLATPALLVDVDEMRPGAVLDATALHNTLFIHARVAATGGDAAGFYRDKRTPLFLLDVSLPPGGAYLATGLYNEWSYDNSYFWARNLGSGARRPARGSWGTLRGDAAGCSNLE